MMKFLKRRAPLFCTVGALLIASVIFAIYKAQNSTPTNLSSYEQSGQILSELSRDDALGFVISCNIKIPDSLDENAIKDLTFDTIIAAELNPQLQRGDYSYTVVVDYCESVRKAVNEYYGIDGSPYLSGNGRGRGSKL
jgi:hypothetical protein